MMMMMPVTAMPTMVPAASLVQSQLPNAPPTLVVDTSPQAMMAQGLPSMAEEVRPRSILRRPNSPSRFRSASPPTPSFSINKLDSTNSSNGESAPPVSSNMRVNIVKEG